LEPKQTAGRRFNRKGGELQGAEGVRGLSEFEREERREFEQQKKSQ